MQVNTPDKSFLVVSYLHRNNWKAFCNNKEMKILRSYGGFMCVEVPEGQSVIHFEYTPYEIYWGLLFSLCSILIPLFGFYANNKWNYFKNNIPVKE